MARPVVPIRIRRGVVRGDVARAIVGTVVQVAPTPNSTHRVGINEVGVKIEIPTKVYCDPKLWMIITNRFSFCLFLEENYEMRMEK